MRFPNRESSKKLRVGIEATPMAVAQRTGIEKYAAALVREMASLSQEETDLEPVVYLHGGNPYASPKCVQEAVDMLTAARVAWRLYPQRRAYGLFLALCSRLDRLDLLHFLRPTFARFLPCPYMLTVHDIRTIGLSEEGRRLERASLTSLEERAILGAAAVSADSSSARNDLCSYFGHDLAVPVQVIHLGVDPAFYDARSHAEEVRAKYGLERYILFVGALQYRKNLPALTQAFALVKQGRSIPHKLVLAGRDGWGAEHVYAAVKDHHLEDDVLFLGHVPEDDLPGLYAGADLFAYPSLHEGFGLPILEAMAAGTVVLTSGIYSMPEVAGDAAILVDPHNVDSIAAGLWQALDSADLRKELVLKGSARVRQFTWRQTALRTRSLYQQIATG